MSDETEKDWGMDEDIQDALEQIREKNPAWVEFALDKSRRIGLALASCDGIAERDALGARLYLMTCMSDYYFLCAHYGAVDKPFRFAGEVPLSGNRWFCYTEDATGSTGLVSNSPVVEVEGQDRPDHDVPRASMVVEALEPDEGPQIQGFLLPQKRDNTDFGEVIREFYAGHEEGFRCDREGDTLIMSWGFEDLSELLARPNTRLWDVKFDGDDKTLN